MSDVAVELEELIDTIRAAWPGRFTRGPYLHLHLDAVRLTSGGIAQVRILVHQIVAPEALTNTLSKDDPNGR